MKIFLLFLTFLTVYISPVLAMNIIDLGSYGFTCQAQKLPDFHQIYSDADSFSLEHIDFSYRPKGLTKGAREELQFKLKGAPNSLNNKTIFVFSALDDNSVLRAKTVHADYGVCIAYNSLDDIKHFREASGVTFPIQLGNDDTISFFKIQSYPALITINNGTVYVKTNF